MLERVWRKGNPLTLLVGMQTSIATIIGKCCKDSETGMLLRHPLSITGNEWTETQSKTKPSSVPMFCTGPCPKLSS